MRSRNGRAPLRSGRRASSEPGRWRRASHLVLRSRISVVTMCSVMSSRKRRQERWCVTPRPDTGACLEQRSPVLLERPPRSHRFRRKARRSQASACPESGNRRKGVPCSESCARCLSLCHSVASSRMRRGLLRSDADAAGPVVPSRCQRKGSRPVCDLHRARYADVARSTDDAVQAAPATLTDFFSNTKAPIGANLPAAL